MYDSLCDFECCYCCCFSTSSSPVNFIFFSCFRLIQLCFKERRTRAMWKQLRVIFQHFHCTCRAWDIFPRLSSSALLVGVGEENSIFVCFSSIFFFAQQWKPSTAAAAKHIKTLWGKGENFVIDDGVLNEWVEQGNFFRGKTFLLLLCVRHESSTKNSSLCAHRKKNCRVKRMFVVGRVS